MKRRTIAASLGLLLSLQLMAQQPKLFVPLNVQRAIERGTRTTDGKPGPNYFQNRSDYRIKATFDPKTGELVGRETIVYENNSPDSLRNIILRLYPNLFKVGAERQSAVDPADLNNGVELQEIRVNGSPISTEKLKYAGTNAIIPMKPSIKANTSVTLDIAWKVKLPNKTKIRMGRYDTGTYFVAYWYPQIAVYDDINGWSTDSYTGLQEFYNDYCSFDVEITLPRNQVAWATGELQNADAIFSDKILERIASAKKSDQLVRVVTAEDIASNSILKADTENVWRFKASNVPDFAFGVSDSYVWDATSVEVDPATQRRVLVNAVYKVGSTAGENVAEIAQRSIKRLSEKLIGVPYPYPHMTVYEGDFGMEFPMMCNDGPVTDPIQKAFVTSHEVSHSYFPFMVGTNETLYGWIDEGLVTFIPKAIEQEYGNTNAHYYIAAWGKRTMGTTNDVPLSVPSTNLNVATSFMQNYGRAAVGFYFLHDMLGEKVFQKVIKEYVTRWASKHPTPTDLIYTINSVTGKDYSWYWNPWFYKYGYADLALEDVTISDDKVNLTVTKKGLFPVPVKLTVTFNDGTTQTIYHTAQVWEKSSTWRLKQTFDKKVAKVALGDANIPDAFAANNTYRVN